MRHVALAAAALLLYGCSESTKADGDTSPIGNDGTATGGTGATGGGTGGGTGATGGTGGTGGGTGGTGGTGGGTGGGGTGGGGTGGGGTGGTGGSGTGTGGGTGLDPLDCSADYAVDTPNPVDCLTDEIFCGDVIYHSNTGGSDVFEADLQFEFCSGSANGADFAGPERVYRFNAPPDVRSVAVTVDSCEDTWALWYQDYDGCQEERLVSCSSFPYGDFRHQWANVLIGGTRTLWLVVEGYQNSGGNFRMQIECFE